MRRAEGCPMPAPASSASASATSNAQRGTPRATPIPLSFLCLLLLKILFPSVQSVSSAVLFSLPQQFPSHFVSFVCFCSDSFPISVHLRSSVVLFFFSHLCNPCHPWFSFHSHSNSDPTQFPQFAS